MGGAPAVDDGSTGVILEVGAGAADDKAVELAIVAVEEAPVDGVAVDEAITAAVDDDTVAAAEVDDEVALTTAAVDEEDDDDDDDDDDDTATTAAEDDEDETTVAAVEDDEEDTTVAAEDDDEEETTVAAVDDDDEAATTALLAAEEDEPDAVAAPDEDEDDTGGRSTGTWNAAPYCRSTCMGLSAWLYTRNKSYVALTAQCERNNQQTGQRREKRSVSKLRVRLVCMHCCAVD